MISCANHPEVTDPEFHCPRCERFFCRECVIAKPFEKSVLYLCRTCGHPVTNITPFKPTPPFWTRVPRILAFPFQGVGVVILLIWPVWSLILRATPVVAGWEAREFAPVWIGTPFQLMYVFIMFPLLYRITETAAHGHLSFFDVSAGQAMTDVLAGPIIRVIGPLLGYLGPAVFIFMLFWSTYMQPPTPTRTLFLYVLLFGFFLWIVLGMFLFPMSLLAMIAFGSLQTAVNPLFLFSQMRKIWREYLRFFLIAALMISIYLGIRTLMVTYLLKDTIPSHFLFFAIDGEFHIYLVMTIGFMQGYMGYQCRFKLKWWPETREEPSFMIGGERVAASTLPFQNIEQPVYIAQSLKALAAEAAAAGAGAMAAGPAADQVPGPPEPDQKLSEDIRHGMYLIEHGNYKDAAALFKELVAANPENIGAIQGLIMASFRLHDYDTVKAHAGKLAADFARQQAFEALWDMYQGYKDIMPEFTLDPPELIAMAAWLEGNGQYLEAARVLRELAVLHPDDERAAESLFHCAELLRDQCGKRDNAKNVFQGIISRYPGSEFADQARQALEELDGEEERPDEGDGPPTM